MKPITVQHLIQTLSPQILQNSPSISFSSISTDSRTIQPNSLFVALSGKNHNGHLFLEDVAKKGAKGALISEEQSSYPDKMTIFKVSDTLQSLGRLAGFYRQQFTMPIVAITGSNGKTTTKEMIRYLLEKIGSTLSTHKNFNNAIGVPFNLFQLHKKFQYAVLEMGANHRGEIQELTKMISPDLGVITNVALAHLEGFGSMKEVRNAKGELSVELGKKPLIINGDNSYCLEIAKKHKGKVVTFGFGENVDVRGKIVKSENGRFWVEVDQEIIKSPLLGKHNVYNLLTAISVVKTLGLPSWIYKSWKNFSPPKMRMEALELDGILFIKDCYNANPHSTKKALEVLSSFQNSGKKIFLLGEMLELGEQSAYFHGEIAKEAKSKGVDLALSIGEESLEFSKTFQKLGGIAFHFTNHQNIYHFLKETLQKGDLLLLKGSRKSALEKVLELWIKKTA